jgi:hypothetical protein
MSFVPKVPPFVTPQDTLILNPFHLRGCTFRMRDEYTNNSEEGIKMRIQQL